MSDNIEREAQFLIERLRQFENENMDEAAFRDWNGHVSPSIARFEQLLTAARAQGEGEAVAWLRFRSCRIAADDVVEGLEVCRPDEIGDDGSPAFPVFDRSSAGAVPEVAQLVYRVMDICGNPKGVSESGQEELYELALQVSKQAMLTAAPTAPVEGGGVPVAWGVFCAGVLQDFAYNEQAAKAIIEAEYSGIPDMTAGPLTNPNNGEQLEIERGYSKALERRIAELEKGDGEQGGEWVRCPAGWLDEARRDFEGGDSADHYNLLRDLLSENPPTEREDGHE